MKGTKLYVLDNGTIKMDKNFLVSAHNPGSLLNPNPPAEYVEFPVYCVLIDHPDGKILFDTGCNPESMGKNGRWPEYTQTFFPWFASEECYLHNRLAQLKVRPEEIKYVVASHLHLDHAGCLEMFTNATIIVNDAELSNTAKTYLLKKDMGAYMWADIDAWAKVGLNWRTVKSEDNEVPLLDGIKILNFGSGHAYGMLGLHVQLPGMGGIILASDALYTAANYGPPVRHPGIIYDTIGYSKSAERIRAYAERTKSTVWFGHDADQFETFLKSTEGYYE